MVKSREEQREWKLVGIGAKRGRWLPIPMGMTVLLCLGTVYSWSIFRKPLESPLKITATESLLPYTVSLLFFSIFMPIAGFLIPKIGPRVMKALGGLLVGVGIAGYPDSGWFPDKKGLAVGLTIMGFGLSPLCPFSQLTSVARSKQFPEMGIAFMIIIGAMAIALGFPPKDWNVGVREGDSSLWALVLLRHWGSSWDRL